MLIAMSKTQKEYQYNRITM